MSSPKQQALALAEALPKIEDKFLDQNNYKLSFKSECLFAKQQIISNNYALGIAANNSASLINAILNVAAIGISLNPASALAYLVPRKGGICLDISYRGLVKLATDSGAIEWAKPKLVYEGDTFQERGVCELPIHEMNTLDPDRMNAADPLEKCIGGYCVAKLKTGDYLVDVMTIGEILEIRNVSMAYQADKPCPWKGKWSGEMAKKTLIKRASKSWPQSTGRERFDNALAVINEHEGIDFAPAVSMSDYLPPSPEQTAKYLELAKGDPVEFWSWYSSLDQRIQSSLPNCEFEKGKKGETMAFFNGQLKAGREKLEEYYDLATDLAERDDEAGLDELFDEISADSREHIIDRSSAAVAAIMLQSLERIK